MAEQKIAHILLVEDSPSDAELAKKAFQRAKQATQISHVHDGIDAMAFLRGEVPFEKRTLPDLVLLDLNMPRMSGRETLRQIKSDKRFSKIPVVVMTTTADEAEITAAYQENANAFMIKPVDLKQFFESIAQMTKFWFDTVTLPSS